MSLLGALAGCATALIAPSAQATVTHEFLPEPTATLSAGVPAGCGAALAEPPCIAGPLSEVSALWGEAGHLWAAERIATGASAGKSRVDRFDTTTGVFLGPQLDEVQSEELSGLENGVAVGVTPEEEVYVGAAKSGVGGVVAVFNGSGAFQHVWTGASTANKSFTGNGNLRGVAVDRSANPVSVGDVYVATSLVATSLSLSGVVDVFRPVTGGGEEPAVVGEIHGTCPVQGTTCAGKEVPFRQPSRVTVSGFNGDVFVGDNALDGEGNVVHVVDVFEPLAGGEYKYLFQLTGTPTGGPAGEHAGFAEVRALAVDAGSGEVYVADASNTVSQFTATGAYLGRLTGTPKGLFASVPSVAVDPSSHRVFVGDLNSETQRGVVDVFGPSLLVPDVTTAPASEPVPGGVTLNGTLGLAGQGEAKCWFALGTSEAFGRRVPCEPESTGGPEEQPVKAKATGLLPDTTYFYRLQAGNRNGTNTGEPFQTRQFTTGGPGLHGEWSSEVASGSVTLDARINPNANATSYYFQYGTSTSYGSEIPIAPGVPLGAGSEDVTVGRHVQGLAASTLYHYRVVAVSGGVSYPGEDHTFTTQAAEGFALPDSRAWELVSPPDKHGSVLQPIGESSVIQSSVSGDAISYRATVPTEEAAQGYSEYTQLFSDRGAGGVWSSSDISLPHSALVGTATGQGSEYRYFSEDLSRVALEPFGAFTSLGPESSPADTERTPYIRHNASCSPAPNPGCFEPLLTAAPGAADVPQGTKFGGAPEEIASAARFEGATPDLAHVVLSSGVPLTATRVEGTAKQLYEWSAGSAPSERLRLVSVLPDGEPSQQFGATLGFNNRVARHAISNDGSRVVWTEGGGARHLYLRANATQPQSPVAGGRCTVSADACTVQLDAVQSGSGEGEASPVFQSASSDGTRVYFTDLQPLTAGSGQVHGHADLYECEIVAVSGEPACRLTDLTPQQNGEDANVQGGLLGSSENGTSIYFVAKGAITTAQNSPHEAAAAGAQNLYALHYSEATGKWEEPTFITTLSNDDEPDWTVSGGLGGGGSNTGSGGQTARVSPDGRWLTFMSDRSLTGYDNLDLHTDRPDEEVYLYNSATGHLACASCNPTGARPTGIEYGNLQLAGGFEVFPSRNHQWIAANIPAWTAFSDTEARYQSRYLSDSGRLFFNSSDALVPQDVNNNEDVYQFEPAGIGSCTTTAPGYDPATGGCVALISSGTAAGESAFLDASQSGNDVFFLTGERLTPQDTDGSLDLYDAHVCSETAPCATQPVPPPPCTTADACRAAPTPQPGIFGAPPSALFNGIGNLTPTPPAAPAKPTSLTNSQELAKALKACRTKHNRHKRTACEKQAHKRYGTAHKARRPSNHTTRAKGTP